MTTPEQPLTNEQIGQALCDAIMTLARDGRHVEADQLTKVVDQLRQAKANVSGEAAALWGTGWICGNNYRERGVVCESVGKPDGEPWYVTQDGVRWSAYDVRFKPDPATPPSTDERPPMRVMQACKKHEGIPFVSYASAYPVSTYCPHCPPDAAMQPDEKA